MVVFIHSAVSSIVMAVLFAFNAFNIAGKGGAKSYCIMDPLIGLIKGYSEKFDIIQKDIFTIFTIAFINFFKKYGYREVVKMQLKI